MDAVDTSGFARLGQILGGGSAASPQQAAQFALAQDRQASLQEKLAKAGIDRAQLLALQSIPVAHSQSLVAQNFASDPGNPLGSPAAIAAARAAYGDAVTMSPSGTGANLKDFNESQLTDQKSEMARIAMAAGQTGDYKAMNAALAAISGKPMDVDKVEGGVSYNPTIGPNQQTAVVLPTGQADIAQKGAASMADIARAAASQSEVPLHNASAAEATARTGLIGTQNARITQGLPMDGSAKNAVSGELGAAIARAMDPNGRASPNPTGDPITDSVKAVMGAFSGKAPTVVDHPAALSVGVPPISALREGAHTTFKNGQTWTLVNGKPVRVN